MLWDRHDLDRYERWRASRRGAFAFEQECHLFERLTAAWPRRGRSLLDVGCGPGLFLEFFHRAGLDVTGFDNSPVMLQAARERLGDAVELNLGDAGHLPYDPDSFDYVALLTLLEFVPDPARVLREAARVARQGILIAYLNRFSLYRLSAKNHTLIGKARWFNPLEIRALVIRSVGMPPAGQASVLLGPECTWASHSPISFLGKAVTSLPIGAYCAMTIDLTTEPPLTPLAAFARAQPTKSF